MNKQEAILYLKVSWLAYGVEMDLNDFVLTATFENTGTDTQGLFGVAFDNTLVVAFRGTDEKGYDWITNVRFSHQVYPYGNSDSRVKVHRGFITAYKSVRETILEKARQSSFDRVMCTGHSLGGALATLAAVDIQYNIAEKEVVCYTYGAPKVGNKPFASSYNKRVPQTYRFVNENDIVPKLPRWWNGYAHVEKLYRIGPSRFNWRIFSRGVADHYPHNYLKALQMLP
jgi:triacylglycerol lipase